MKTTLITFPVTILDFWHYNKHLLNNTGASQHQFPPVKDNYLNFKFGFYIIFLYIKNTSKRNNQSVITPFFFINHLIYFNYENSH